MRATGDEISTPRNWPEFSRRAQKWPQNRPFASVAAGYRASHLFIMRRNLLGRSVVATLVLLLAGCGSSGDEQVAEVPVTNVVTAENGVVVDSSTSAVALEESDDGWFPTDWMNGDWIGADDWFGDDEPEIGTPVVPPPDATTGTDPVTEAQEPTLGAEDLAILPDAPPPEIVEAAMPAAPSIPAELQTDDPSVLAVRYSSDLNPEIIQLLTPNGTVIEPLAIGEVTHWTEEDRNRTRFRFGLTGGSASGLNPSFAVGIPIFGSDLDDQKRPTQNQANFKLPDLADYEKNWQLYRVVMLFKPGTPEEERFEMLPPHPDTMLR
jgi:hypothetical protein